MCSPTVRGEFSEHTDGVVLSGRQSGIGSFSIFIALYELVQIVENRSEKCNILAKYLSNLDSEELFIASRLLSGKYVEHESETAIRRLKEAAINSIAACTGVSVAFVKERHCALGSVSEVAFELVSGGLTISDPRKPTLQSVAVSLTQLKSIRNARKRIEHISDLLRQSTPSEAKFFVSVVCAEYNAGSLESYVKSAISQWLNISITRIQSINLQTGDIGETAVICRRGEIESSGFRLFQPIQFTIGKETTSLPEVARLMPSIFVVEDCFDGLRAQIHIGLDIPHNGLISGTVYEGIRVAIFSESLDDITAAYLEIIPGLTNLFMDAAGPVFGVGVILDGVIVSVVDRTVRPISEYYKPTNPTDLTPAIIKDVRLGFVAFDQLYGEGRSLTAESWYDRISILHKNLFDQQTIFCSPSKIYTNVNDVVAELTASLYKGNAGLMIKNPAAKYHSGRLDSDWLNIKRLSPVTSSNGSQNAQQTRPHEKHASGPQ